MHWKEFFKPTILKVTIAIILQIIQYVGLAVCFGGGDLLCNFNPTVWVFEFVGQTFSFLGMLVFPFILIASFIVTYALVCGIAQIIKKMLGTLGTKE